MSNTWRPADAPSQPMGLVVEACARPCADVEALLGPGGPIATGMPNWEDRPQQRRLSQTVRRAFRQRRHALTEGQCGVGKSHALLVPAILHALETGKPVVYSTRTLALQAQLVDQDLPLLQRLLTPWLEQRFGRNFTWADQRGLKNYLCEVKAEHSQEDLDDIRDQGGHLPPHLRHLAAERTECPGARCRVAKEGQCWFYLARAQARAADIVVVNHSLLVAALLADPGTVLPQWDAAIIDEAHSLEEVAREALGVSLTAGRVRKLADAACELVGGNQQGLLAEETALAKECCQQHRYEVGGCHPLCECPGCPTCRSEGQPERPVCPPGAEEASTLLDHGSAPGDLSRTSYHTPTPEAIDAELAGLFRELEQAIRPRATDGTALLPPLAYSAAGEHLQELLAHIRRLSVDVASAGDWHAEESAERAKADVLKGQLATLYTDLAGLRSEAPGRVAWLELARGKQPAALRALPVDVSGFLRDSLLKTPTALSSATLATGTGEKAFAYVSQALGVSTLHQVQVPSPFDWPKQAWIYLPEEGLGEHLLGLKERDPEKRDILQREYCRVSAMHIREVLRATRGRGFLLFSSAKALELTRGFLTAGDFPWPHISQGEMSVSDTLAWFRSTQGAVLFGLVTYSEGVDVSGDALSVVVLDRIPFPPPSDLLHQARLTAAGGGVRAFQELSVPWATTKLKQGFGRLIRSCTDRGLAVLLDPRLRGKHAGILDSLPPARRIARGDLRHVGLFLAGAGEPCEGPADVVAGLLALDVAAMPAEHAAWARRLCERLPLLTPGLWRLTGWLCERYGRAA